MKTRWGELCDDLGPAKIVFLRERAAGLQAVVVVDNLAAGPAIGGVRMAVDLTVEEVMRLARAMTLKNAAAGLPYGGGKAGICADPAIDRAGKERLVRSFARAIASLTEYVPGPDMGTDEACMGWIHDEIGRAVGLPRVLGGIPLDQVGATGLGLAACAEAVQAAGDLRLEDARVAVQGFGAVGGHAARFLVERGAVLVAASDSAGAVVNPAGLEVAALGAWKAEGHSVGTFPGGAPMPRDDLLGMDCDLLVPAARPDVLDAGNAELVRATVVLEGANIPATGEAEQLLHKRGVLVVPDIIANAGGVICASVEHRGGTQTQALALVQEKIAANTAQVLADVRELGILPRQAAEDLARARIAEATSYRRSW
ncbi:MAG TPA: Glu/Leu/Phe/Val dehydrogenase [Actinomycetota bacterium]|jgi:glutamate dehydrogenase/leucine dehydrogenase|nr:Glu/Leu/Phe/Val dehydrogenase [Actinomycetota bacterium]